MVSCRWKGLDDLGWIDREDYWFWKYMHVEMGSVFCWYSFDCVLSLDFLFGWEWLGAGMSGGWYLRFRWFGGMFYCVSQLGLLVFTGYCRLAEVGFRWELDLMDGQVGWLGFL